MDVSNCSVLKFGLLHEVIDMGQIRSFGQCKEGFEPKKKKR